MMEANGTQIDLRYNKGTKPTFSVANLRVLRVREARRHWKPQMANTSLLCLCTLKSFFREWEAQSVRMRKQFLTVIASQAAPIPSACKAIAHKPRILHPTWSPTSRQTESTHVPLAESLTHWPLVAIHIFPDLRKQAPQQVSEAVCFPEAWASVHSAAEYQHAAKHI